ncbi:MAG: hypothetical protein ACAI43_26885 [Phycisphaerae bacterium]|nr:hypothetical protein [Tepidisphaeraceae bacterium]
MSREVRAVIRWVPTSRGGRQAPPTPAAGYTCPARFENDVDAGGTPSGAQWSLRIVSAVELRTGEVVDARVRFLLPDAPHDLLRDGERFEMLEGRRVVAKGVVLPDAVAAPAHINEFELALLG